MQILSIQENHYNENEFIDRVLAEIRSTIILNSSGLLSQMAFEIFSNPGKMIRSKIVFCLGKIFDVPQPQLIAWAASIELLHNASLVHDDLQDRDEVRRGQLTVWKKYGASQAINLGDFFILVAQQPVLSSEAPDSSKVELCKLFSKGSARLVNGQSFEPQLNSLWNEAHVLENYLFCISQKTSALFSLAAEGTAVLAQYSPGFKKNLAELFVHLGNAFQIQDDILDLYGDKQRESIGCDIREGKVSILVAHHLQAHPEDLESLKGILKKPRELTTEEEVLLVVDLFLKKGALKKSLQHLDELLYAVTSHSLVSEIPDLSPLVQQLVKKIVKPIEHVKSSCL